MMKDCPRLRIGGPQQGTQDMVPIPVATPPSQPARGGRKKPGGLLQRLDILEWNWECITMEFVAGLPRTLWRFDVVWVFMDRPTNYQLSIKIALNEALYRRRCCSLVGWFEPGEAKLLCTDLVRDALEKVKLIQERIHTVQSRQKGYADRKARDVAFVVGERVLRDHGASLAIMERRYEAKGFFLFAFEKQAYILMKFGIIDFVIIVAHVDMLRRLFGCWHEDEAIRWNIVIVPVQCDTM
nr:uncharacterized protein LOC104117386 [Nicotiana tomentosiformis]